jgi:1-phosphofructokinase family hexose kinase
MVSSSATFLCVSANPAIDKRILAKSFRVGEVNRVADVTAEPGGKAAHVALSLVALGEQPSWIGLAGSASGDELVEGLKIAGIQTHRVGTQKPTRVNLAILDGNGLVTEILEPGGPISPSEVDSFRNACEHSFLQMKDHGFVILSGSLPPGIPEDFYATLIRSARSAGCRTFLDTRGEGLKAALSEHPDFVKPNKEEAELVLGTAITNASQARSAVSEFFARGARSVALSLGRDGLLWCPGPKEQMCHVRPVAVEGRSCVGSGDATVAGFAHAIARGLPSDETARLAAACGAANCLADSPGRIRMADVEQIRKRLTFEMLD